TGMNRDVGAARGDVQGGIHRTTARVQADVLHILLGGAHGLDARHDDVDDGCADGGELHGYPCLETKKACRAPILLPVQRFSTPAAQSAKTRTRRGGWR